MVPDAWSNVARRDLKFASVPTVTHESERVGEEARNAVLKGEQIHYLRLNAAWHRASVEGLVNLEPHHDGEVDIDISGASAEDGQLDALVQAQGQVRHLHLVRHAVELSATFVISFETIVIFFALLLTHIRVGDVVIFVELL